MHGITEAGKTIPPDRAFALLEVLCHSILNVRSLGCEFSSRRLFDLMDAIHNIPIYLQHGGDDFWDTIELDMARYDETYRADPFPMLHYVFDRGMRQYAEKIQNIH